MPQMRDWASYPSNIEVGGSNVLAYSSDCVHRQLLGEKDRLFTEDKIRLKVVELGRGEHRIADIKALDTYLEEATKTAITRVILIPHLSSWGPLYITYEATCKILSTFNVHPAFVDILRAFGSRTSYGGDTYSGYRLQINNRTANSVAGELSYLIKYTEENEKSEPQSPWSVRQTGVYQRIDPAGDVFIVLNPSTALKERLQGLHNHEKTLSSWALHVAILTAASENWRWYITYMEKTYDHMRNRSHLSQIVELPGSQDDKLKLMTDVKYDDSQDIQLLQDQCMKLCHFLKANSVLLKALEREQVQAILENRYDVQQLDALTPSLITETNLHFHRAEGLLRRLNGTFKLVQSILDFRNLASLQCSNKAMAELARLSQRENKLLVELESKASNDTIIVRRLSFVAIAYLPASFVSSLMGMGYVKITNRGDTIAIRIESEFWIFVILATILLMATLGLYYGWDSLKSKLNSRRPQNLA